ncbi:MAG TPA: DUF4926 domain-containing protein [Lacipirellulaceae bacterium]|nr:DUF4926 domain-containing protein [Lacipirellulaceae bacterium]
MLREHERVVLTVPLPEAGLIAGDVGTIVHLYRDGEAYEVEFVALDGHTTAVATLETGQLRSVTPRDMAHSREIQPV